MKGHKPAALLTKGTRLRSTKGGGGRGQDFLLTSAVAAGDVVLDDAVVLQREVPHVVVYQEHAGVLRVVAAHAAAALANKVVHVADDMKNATYMSRSAYTAS